MKLKVVCTGSLDHAISEAVAFGEWPAMERLLRDLAEKWWSGGRVTLEIDTESGECKVLPCKVTR